EFVHAAQRGILPQQTHHNRLAVQHGNHRNTNVHLCVVEADLDAAVLGEAFLGDIEMAQNLDAGNDRRLEAFHLRRHGNLLQNTVDAIADAQFVFKRFEVNVRGAQIDGVAQDLVDEADDRRVLGGGG